MWIPWGVKSNFFGTLSRCSSCRLALNCLSSFTLVILSLLTWESPFSFEFLDRLEKWVLHSNSLDLFLFYLINQLKRKKIYVIELPLKILLENISLQLWSDMVTLNNTRLNRFSLQVLNWILYNGMSSYNFIYKSKEKNHGKSWLLKRSMVLISIEPKCLSTKRASVSDQFTDTLRYILCLKLRKFSSQIASSDKLTDLAHFISISR